MGLHNSLVIEFSARLLNQPCFTLLLIAINGWNCVMKVIR